VRVPIKLKPTKVLAGERLRDQIYDFVRSEMRLGLLAPRERLKEVELAERLGVSRTPVREALFQLARDGLLEERNQGYGLPHYSEQELDDRLEIRLLLEPAIARHVALEANAAQLAKLRKALAQEAEAAEVDDARRFLLANLQFKLELFEICRNKLLGRAARLYDDQFQHIRLKTFASKPNRAATVKQHRELVAAVAAKNGRLAEQAMRALLETAVEFQREHPIVPDEAGERPTKIARKGGRDVE
jgi:DNA-binding GntR family transcriptional regulator